MALVQYIIIIKLYQSAKVISELHNDINKIHKINRQQVEYVCMYDRLCVSLELGVRGTQDTRHASHEW